MFNYLLLVSMAKNKGGRPKKGLDVLPRSWKKKVVEIGESGGSDVEMRDYLGISDDLWYRFIDEEPEFSRTIREAKRKCQLWWEKTGREGLFMGGKDNPFNATVWVFNMKNRFKWSDRNETTTTVSLSDELKRIADKLPD